MITLGQSAFLRESNSIEREDWGKLPEEALAFALAHVGKNIHPGDIRNLHLKHKDACVLFHGGQEHIHYGEWRKDGVRVGAWIAPEAKDLNMLMADYCADWKEMNAFEAHVRFEKIHPFEDLNGRTGRILWLIKALEEGYDYSIPFLQAFYYQSLRQPI
jgi:hypothetical protein